MSNTLVLSAEFEEGVASSIASKIGENLADTAIGAIGDLAMGEILSVLGLGSDDYAAMNAKLDLILAGLQAIENKLDGLRVAVEYLAYDTLYLSKVSDLVNKNDFLKGKFSDYLTAPTDATRQSIRTQILDVVQSTAFREALVDWHNAITGKGLDSGLIQRWGKATFDSKSIYGPVQAALFQQQWDFLDAQQALTVSYLMEGYNALGDAGRPQAMTVLTTWYANRQQQLALVRGGTNRQDVFTKADPSTNTSSTVTTTLECLPAGTLYSKTSNLCWSLTGVQNFHFDPQAQPAFRAAVDQFNTQDQQGPNPQNVYGRFALPVGDQVGQLVGDAGGSQSSFVGALAGYGMTLAPMANGAPINLVREYVFKDPEGDDSSDWVFVNHLTEGQSTGPANPGDFIHIPLARPPLKQYWYAS